QEMFGEAEPQLHVRYLLEHFGLDQMAGEATDVVAHHRMAVERSMRRRQQARHRALDVLDERRTVRREPTTALPPPTDGTAPEPLLAAACARLDVERLVRDRRARIRERRGGAPPPGLPLPRRLVHRLVQAPVVLAPPVTEKVFVCALADLDDR